MRLRSFASEPTGLIGPESMQVLGDRVSVNGCWHRTFFVKGFPREAEPGFLAPLLCHPGSIDVSIHVVPVPNRAAIDRIKKQRGRHESTVLNDAAKGRITDPEVVAAASDAADLMSALATGESRIFLVGIYVTARAWNEEQLDEESARVEAVCASLGLDLRVLRERRTAALTATLPIAVDPLQMYRPMDTKAFAACFPFVSAEIGTVGGVLYGRNTSTAGLVLLDRFGLENYNQIVLAHSGKGKSYFAKLQVLRSLYEGIEAIVVDPENEYERLADAVGGTVVRLGTDGCRLNPLDLARAGEPDAIVHQSLFVHSVVECLVGKVPQVHKAILDRAILDAYALAGITTDPRTHIRPAPLLGDVVASLRESGGESLAGRLDPYVSGSHRGLFDAPTSVRADGHLVVFSLREVAEELKPAATLMVLESIWRRVTSGERKRRIVVVDEAWLLLKSESGGRFLERLARSARKYWCGLTTITQDVRDALSTDAGRTILTNASSQILFGQHPQALDALSEAFGLSEGERSYLGSCSKGQGLLCVGAERATLKVVASDAEHRLVTTDPSELEDEDER